MWIQRSMCIGQHSKRSETFCPIQVGLGLVPRVSAVSGKAFESV